MKLVFALNIERKDREAESIVLFPYITCSWKYMHHLTEQGSKREDGRERALIFFLLEYNCFTVLCWFLLYNEVNQLYVYMYPLPLGPPSSPPHPTHLGHHRAQS